MNDDNLIPFDLSQIPDEDPAVEALLSHGRSQQAQRRLTKAEREQQKREMEQKERERQKWQARSRASYDLPKELIRLVAEKAQHVGTTNSQVAALALAVGMRQLAHFDFFPIQVPSDSPRYEWNLEIDEILEGLFDKGRR